MRFGWRTGKSKMAPFLLLLLLSMGIAAAASALPPPLKPRQTWTVGYWAHDLSDYGCKPIILIWAKATIEPGNMGNTVGPRLSDGLKALFGPANVATQGVDYWGFIDTNFYPGGAPPWGIYDMQLLLSAAATCPNSKIVAAGYSQGAALTHRAIEGLSQATKDRIAGVVTFGDTQVWQDGGRIRNFDPGRTLIICNAGDLVCTGTLYVFPVHFDYVKWVPAAAYYLAGKLLEDAAARPWPNGSFVYPSGGGGGNGSGNGNGTAPSVPVPVVVPPVPPPPQAPTAVPLTPPLPVPDGVGDGDDFEEGGRGL
ncbi:carbohydrate esterase family 5 protein [Hypoxylon fragiforme]|uniref:carbohydrate esterase family 5 protein n=1 Tax=Hypoxylon fragiforme TaxID=63214 RepID=UPI0020C6447D|nr:carbohydrate esterase family 5 protein [Hypoxylon fragiforme]KAI2608756.1 carbohydrate esterase family 5 protein [Hypoxylon fragiforme]